MKKLTRKEKLFCLYYAQNRNARAAAAKAGFALPEQAALRLLRTAHVRRELETLAGEERAGTDELLAGYRKLAFGSGTDALRLLFGSVQPEDFDALDLFNVAEIKKPKDGALEIKFFDRLKALEHLEALCGADRADSGLPLYRALMRSVGTDEDEGGDNHPAF
jgi:hypothetical protein